MHSHRQIGGKGLLYPEDTEVLMIFRAPGIPAKAFSDVSSTHNLSGAFITLRWS